MDSTQLAGAIWEWSRKSPLRGRARGKACAEIASILSGTFPGRGGRGANADRQEFSPALRRSAKRDLFENVKKWGKNMDEGGERKKWQFGERGRSRPECQEGMKSCGGNPDTQKIKYWAEYHRQKERSREGSWRKKEASKVKFPRKRKSHDAIGRQADERREKGDAKKSRHRGPTTSTA